MSDSSMRLTVRLSAAPGERVEADELESLTLRLRQELLDLGADQVERVSVGAAPPGARGVDVAGIFQLVATVLGAAATVAQLVEFVERWRQRQDRGHALRIDVVETEPGIVSSRITGREALIVANAAYEDPALSRLRSPTHDADALARVLADPAVGGFDVDLLTDADERTVRRRVAEFFAGRDRDEVLLLHFSGHGVKDARGRLHLAARDTEIRRLAATAVPASLVNDLMAESASTRIIFILDCCYSGAFARGALVRADRGVHLADEFGGGTGRIVLTASSATEYSFDGDVLSDSDASPSVFTGALVRGMATGAADLNADGEISVDELFDYAHRQVAAHTPGQAPMKFSFGVAGSLTIARSPRTAGLPAQVRADLASDRVVLRLEAVAALQDLLAGPTTAVRELARVELRRLYEHDDSSRVRNAAAVALDLPAADIATPPAPAAGQPVPRLAEARPAVAEAAPVSAAPPPEVSPRVEPAPRPTVPATAVSRVGHPGLLAALVLATVVSLVQLAQMGADLSTRLATGLSGVAFFVVVPAVAAIGLVASVRQRARIWSIGMAAVLVIWVGLFATADLGHQAGLTALVGFYTQGPDQPDDVGVYGVDLTVRLLVCCVGAFWYALRGPRWQRRDLPSRAAHPGLLLAAVAAAVGSLVGAIALSAGASPANHALFNLFGSARADFTSGAVVGIGNIWRAEPNGLDPAGAIWNLGWLVLATVACLGIGSALRQQQRRWAAAMMACLVVAVAIGLAASGWHENAAGVRELALLLAAMTLTTTAGVGAYAWRGTKPSHTRPAPST